MVGSSGRSLGKRIEDLEAKLIEPSCPVCSTCGRAGGSGIVDEVHHYPSGEVTYNGRPEPPCPECERISASTGNITGIVLCEWYSSAPEGGSCPVCQQPSLATIRAKLASGEMMHSEVPPMVEVVPRRGRLPRRPLRPRGTGEKRGR